jgi:hypothetical protein
MSKNYNMVFDKQASGVLCGGVEGFSFLKRRVRFCCFVARGGFGLVFAWSGRVNG